MPGCPLASRGAFVVHRLPALILPPMTLWEEPVNGEIGRPGTREPQHPPADGGVAATASPEQGGLPHLGGLPAARPGAGRPRSRPGSATGVLLQVPRRL